LNRRRNKPSIDVKHILCKLIGINEKISKGLSTIKKQGDIFFKAIEVG